MHNREAAGSLSTVLTPQNIRLPKSQTSAVLLRPQRSEPGSSGACIYTGRRAGCCGKVLTRTGSIRFHPFPSVDGSNLLLIASSGAFPCDPCTPQLLCSSFPVGRGAGRPGRRLLPQLEPGFCHQVCERPGATAMASKHLHLSSERERR